MDIPSVLARVLLIMFVLLLFVVAFFVLSSAQALLAGLLFIMLTGIRLLIGTTLSPWSILLEAICSTVISFIAIDSFNKTSIENKIAKNTQERAYWLLAGLGLFILAIL